MTIMDFDINVELYDKEVFNACLDIFKSYNFAKPVFITENGDGFQFRFNSDYEQFELKNDIAALFEGYHFSENPGN